MTALVIKFSAQTVGQGGGVTARRNERLKGMKQGHDDDDIVSQADDDAPLKGGAMDLEDDDEVPHDEDPLPIR